MFGIIEKLISLIQDLRDRHERKRKKLDIEFIDLNLNIKMEHDAFFFRDKINSRIAQLTEQDKAEKVFKNLNINKVLLGLPGFVQDFYF
jgi:hypothetical protein